MAPVSGEPPTLAELWRRVDQMQADTHERLEGIAKDQREHFIAMNHRLDKMLTAEGLATYMAVHVAELRHLREDHDEFETKMEVRFERQEHRLTNAVRWAVGAVIAGAGVIIATIGEFINAVNGSG